MVAGLGVLLGASVLGVSLQINYIRGGSVAAFDEAINTYLSSDCSTPKAAWDLGQTACAVATGSPDDRRIAWVAPNGNTAQVSNSFSGTANDSYSIPTSGDFAQVGTWTVQTIDANGTANVSAEFVVRDPNNSNADLAIGNYGPFETTAGSNINYRIEIINHGPDDAHDVTVTDAIPSNTTFVSEVQNSGLSFTCTAPSSGSGAGAVTCTIATLPVNSIAVFSLAFNVNAGAANGTVITNVAVISSTTNEPRSADNSASSSATVTAASTVCSINCPSDIDQNNDANQCSAVVSYSTPTTSGSCGTPPDSTVNCNPPSGSTFPIGSTTVTCTTQSGGVCSFAVMVHDTRTPVQPTIDCPADQTVSEDSPGSGQAVVSYPAPVTTGNCVTTICAPPSGSVFSVGTTTVSCTATDSSNNSVSCSFMVTVTSGAACALTCPGDVSQPADANQCTAVVDYSSPTTNGNCGTVTCAPPSHSSFPVGTTTVTCTSSQGPTCDFTVTVVAPAAPTITSCAANRTISVDTNCQAVIPDMTGEVHATGCSVTVSQSPTPGTVVDPGTVTVTFTAENSAGDATCTATVTVSDTTPPVIITCPAGTTVSADAVCQAAVPDVTLGVVATDNCTPSGSLTVTQSPAAGTLVTKGVTNISITVRDASNNAASCATTFTVNDTTPPVAVCRNITVPLDASGAAAITAAQVDNGSHDNCGIASITVSPNAFSCANKGANNVTLTVTDTSNNVSTCTAIVTVVDTILPMISCQADINVDFDPGVGGAVVNYTTPVGTDNCPGATTVRTAGLPSGATFPLGRTTNTFTVTDASGNSASCSFTVTVALTSIVGLDSVSITGSGIVDSYDSTGGYPATKGALANIVSNGTVTVAGSSKVFGNVRSTRAGVVVSGTSQVTGNATAGTTVSKGASAVIGGTITNNQLAPVMTLPAVTACGPPYSPNSGISGTYSYNPSTGDLSLSGINIATLASGTYCFHNITLTNSAQLRVNGLVVIKLTGTLNVGGATSLTNTTGIPANLRILSSFSGSNGVIIANSTNVNVVIYAPNTDVTISGAAPLFGTVAGKTVTVSNSGMIHYDTTLLSIWPDLWMLLLGH